MPRNQSSPRKRILVVEDHPDTRSILCLILTELGYEVIPAESVAEGHERLDGQDLAILDLNLPDGLGSEILQRIRDEHRPIRVAIATAAAEGPVLDHARKLKPDLVLRKPFELDELLEWLKRDD